MSFSFQNVSYGSILKNISFTLPSVGFIGIIGPNGAGKTSLMKLMAAWHKPTAGDVFYEGKNLYAYKPYERAAKIGWLPQEREMIWSLTVDDVINLGAYAQSTQKIKACLKKDILQQTGLYELRKRPIHTLSGGEKNRVHMARLMATQTQTWLLDECDAGLDWHYNHKIFSFLKQQAGQKLIIAILHDLNMAKFLADEILLLDKGELIGQGVSQKVMQASTISEIWQMNVKEGDDGWLKADFLL